MDDEVPLSLKEKTEKLTRLAEDYSLTVHQLLNGGKFDGVAPGICTNEGCSFIDEIEPDQANGWCEECETETVASAFVLAGLI